MVQEVVGSSPISHPSFIVAGIVQWLVCKFSKLEMRVRFSLPAPYGKFGNNYRIFLISVSVNWADSVGVNIFIVINPKSVRKYNLFTLFCVPRGKMHKIVS